MTALSPNQEARVRNIVRENIRAVVAFQNRQAGLDGPEVMVPPARDPGALDQGMRAAGINADLRARYLLDEFPTESAVKILETVKAADDAPVSWEDWLIPAPTPRKSQAGGRYDLAPREWWQGGFVWGGFIGMTAATVVMAAISFATR